MMKAKTLEDLIAMLKNGLVNNSQFENPYSYNTRLVYRRDFLVDSIFNKKPDDVVKPALPLYVYIDWATADNVIASCKFVIDYGCLGHSGMEDDRLTLDLGTVLEISKNIDEAFAKVYDRLQDFVKTFKDTAEILTRNEYAK